MMSDADKQSSESQDGPTVGKKTAVRRRPLLRRTGTAMIRVAVFGYGAILLTLVFMETRMVYPGVYRPDLDLPEPDPSQAAIIDVQYRAADGVELTGRLLERPDSEHTLLFLHGNATRAVWQDDWSRQLSQAFDATVLVAEYRGFDGEGPTPTEQGVISDGIAARDYLCSRQGISRRDLIIYGRSLGGGCAVAVAADGGAKALVLDRTFDSAVDVAADRFPFVPVRWMMRNRFDSVERIGDFAGPLVQMHGTTDAVIPIKHARHLFSVAGEPKAWVEVDGLGHNDAMPDHTLGEIVGHVRDLTSDRSVRSDPAEENE